MQISLKNFSKRYGENDVLNNININNISTGSCVGLLGRNGAGKTTLFNILADLIEPDSGELIIDGLGLKPGDSKWKRTIGISSNDVYALEEMTGNEFLRFVGLLYNETKGTIKERIASLTDYFFDESTLLNKRVNEYSLGNKKRLSICASMIHKPRILLLDEPLANLDIESAKRVVDFLQLYRKNNIVIISSHTISLLTELLTRIVILDSGVVVFDDTLTKFSESAAGIIDDALFDYITRNNKDTEQLTWVND